MSEKLLISACLLGDPVRYDGKSKPIAELDWLKQLQQAQRLFVICPEVVGGLPTPRPPAERLANKVMTESGIDVTEPFQHGAEKALRVCLQNDIKYALLKANSPSCGNQQIYNGEFQGKLVQGMGLTAELLTSKGIEVFSELQLDLLKVKLA